MIPSPQTGFLRHCSCCRRFRLSVFEKHLFNTQLLGLLLPFRSIAIFDLGTELTENQCQSVCETLGVTGNLWVSVCLEVVRSLGVTSFWNFELSNFEMMIWLDASPLVPFRLHTSWIPRFYT